MQIQKTGVNIEPPLERKQLPEKAPGGLKEGTEQQGRGRCLASRGQEGGWQGARWESRNGFHFTSTICHHGNGKMKTLIPQAQASLALWELRACFMPAQSRALEAQILTWNSNTFLCLTQTIVRREGFSLVFHNNTRNGKGLFILALPVFLCETQQF